MKKLFVISLIVSFSCQNDNYIKEYYDNGKLKMECEISDGMKHGKMIEYYPNGNILSLSNWVNDTIHGFDIHYYESGMIKSTSKWYKGQLNGYLVKYDESGNIHLTESYSLNKKDDYEIRYKNGGLHQIKQYTIVGDSSYLNQYMTFDDFGNIRSEKSRFFSIYYPSRSNKIKINQPVNITILLSVGAFIKGVNQMQVVTGEFDDDFNILDKQSLDTLFINDYYTELTFTFDKPGHQYAKGIIMYSYTGKNETIMHEKMYFHWYFYVEE
jgi:antitoxin component YwqK of YwqJK toxin-antitoxin module